MTRPPTLPEQAAVFLISAGITRLFADWWTRRYTRRQAQAPSEGPSPLLTAAELARLKACKPGE